MKTKRTTLALAVGAAAAIAGCGSSSSSSTALTRTQLIAKANAACTAYRTGVTAIPQPSDFLQNPVSAAAYLDKIKPLAHQEVDSIAALAPPADEKSDFDALVGDLRHQLSLFDSGVAKAHAKDRTGITDLEQASTYKSSTIAPLERKLGFTVCAS